MLHRWTRGVLPLCLAACTTSSSNVTAGTLPAELPGFDQGYDRVFSAALTAAAILSWEITLAQMDGGIISARTPMSLATYGDQVTIRVFRPDSIRGDTLTRVGFSSSTEQLVDWGQNSQNQRNFYRRLRQVLDGVASTPQPPDTLGTRPPSSTP
jgi:hypothetical protein